MVALAATGLLISQAAVAGAAQAAPAAPTGTHHVSSAPGTSLNVSILGVNKARLKVRGAGVKRTIRSSKVLQLPVGTYKVKAFKVYRGGTSYKPERRSYRLRATSGTTVMLAVQYNPVKRPSRTPRVPSSTEVSPAPDGLLGTVYALINEARSQERKCGSVTMPAVGPLKYSAAIARAAQKHAEDMAVNKYFDHTSLDGSSFVDRLRAAGYQGDPAGENIASGYTTAQEAVRAWLNSPGHCRNLMERGFDDTGLGFATSDDPRYTVQVTYWVQNFGFDTSVS